MINNEIIKDRLEKMDENLKILWELKSVKKDEFVSDPKTYKLAERCLQLSIQALLDMCHYIIAGNNWERPKDNREAIEIIAQHKVLPVKFAKTILPLAGLRNLLVHEYVKVRPDLLYQHLAKLRDFRTFQKLIIEHIKD